MADRQPITLVIHDVHPYGGHERATYELARRLLARGVEVTVIARRCELPPSKGLRWIRIPGPRRPFVLAHPWFLLLGTIATAIWGRGFRVAAGAIVLNRMDAITVHFCHRDYSKHATAVRRSRASPLHTLNAYLSSLLSLFAERLCYRPSRAGTLIAVSSGLAAELRRLFPAMASRVIVIPNGVDSTEFRPDPDARARVRSEFGLGEEDLVAVFVGGDWERKGLPIALKGIAATGRWHLLVAGEGDADELRRLASLENVGDRLHVIGHTPRPAEVLAAGDAFVLPTFYEPFGMAALEAAATGLPLLMSRVHGGEELVEEGETGFFIERTPESVANRLELLADDPELRGQLGEGARRAALKHGWDEIAQSYESLLASAARPTRGEGSQPAPAPERSRVTIVIHDLHHYGGQERATYELVQRLLRDGAEVTVIARRCELPPNERLRWIRIRGPRRPFLLAYPWFFLFGSIATAVWARGFRQAAGAIVANKLDAVVVHCCHQGYSKVPASEKRGRASVLHTLNARLCSVFSRYTEHVCYRPSRVRTMVAVSHGIADELRRYFPRMASRVTVIPNGVDYVEFRPDPDARARLRKALGLEDGDLVAVFVAGTWEQKGGPIASAGVGDSGRWHLVVGGHAVPESGRWLNGRPGMDDRMHLSGHGAGFRPSELYAAGDAFVFPTSYEGFSLATLEAAAAGLPLLISRVGGAEELLIDGETGFFIDRTPESISHALDRLADDPELRRRMGDTARRVAKTYTWDEAARRYEALYAR